MSTFKITFFLLAVLPLIVQGSMDLGLNKLSRSNQHSQQDCDRFVDSSYDNKAGECRRDFNASCTAPGYWRGYPECRTGLICPKPNTNSDNAKCSCEKGNVWDADTEDCTPIICKTECPALTTCINGECVCNYEGGGNHDRETGECLSTEGRPCDLVDSEEYTLPKCHPKNAYCVPSPSDPEQGMCSKYPDRKSTLMTVMLTVVGVLVVALGVFVVVLGVLWNMEPRTS